MIKLDILINQLTHANLVYKRQLGVLIPGDTKCAIYENQLHKNLKVMLVWSLAL